MTFSIPLFIAPSLPLLLDALGLILVIALLGWLWSVRRQNVNLVDSLWSLLFLAAASLYAWPSLQDPRTQLIFLLVTAWALRLSLHLLRRNWGHTEDRRYATMRERNPPFAWRSLYIVFGILGLSLWSIGFLFESIADAQLHRFRQDPNNRGRVLDRGLWRYSRHPNYFGEACIAWGIYLLAIPTGGAWTIFAPALMTFLLLKVSGVSLLEADIHERRPAYRDYIARTSAFLPRPPRKLEPM
jgi:steroid 5-alpha reductase family enzyme